MEFTNKKTAEQFEVIDNFNWNRKIMIAGKYDGHVKDLTPEAADELIKQGRTDLFRKKVIKTEDSE